MRQSLPSHPDLSARTPEARSTAPTTRENELCVESYVLHSGFLKERERETRRRSTRPPLLEAWTLGSVAPDEVRGQLRQGVRVARCERSGTINSVSETI